MDKAFVLLPQLVPGRSRLLAEELGSGEIAELARTAEVCDLDDVPVMYSPTGGNKMPAGQMRDIAQRIRKKASASGYPDPKSSDRARREFDYATAEFLYGHLLVSVHEASKPGIWEFFTCVLLPDVVRWRFWDATKPTNPERFTGGIRNMFQRLWRRAFVLYDPDNQDAFALMRFLLEDELVQITERPQLSASRALARGTAVAFRRAVARYAGIRREDLMRDAQKRLIRRTPTICFEALDQIVLDQFLETVFDEAAVALATPKKEEQHEGADGSGRGADKGGIGRILRRLRGSAVRAGTQ